MENDVDNTSLTSPVKQNGMVVEVAGPVVIQYTDKKNREKDKKVKNDCYCWVCHHTGTMLCCEKCPRVYHLKCISLQSEPDDDWICPSCTHIDDCAKYPDRSKCCRVNLVKMLPFAIDRMSSNGTEAFQQPVTLDVAPNYFDFVHYPMDLKTLRDHAQAGKFMCTQHFLDEARWILHNCIIFNGGKSRLTALARTVYNVCTHEMQEINLCPDCFLNSCVSQKDWFIQPCKKDHRLVWAKLRGFPFWPAKVLQKQGQQIDVRFFGQHERAWVHESNTLDIGDEPPSGHRNKEAGTNRASSEDEMKRYIDNMKKLGRWPIDLSRIQESLEDTDGVRSPKPETTSTISSVIKKKKKDKLPREPMAKAPKLKISNSLRDDRVNNTFKFEDTELNHKPDRSGMPGGKRRKTDEKVKIEPDHQERLKLKQKLSLKKSTSYILPNTSDNIVDKVFNVSSNGSSAWKYSNKLMEAVSGMVEEMFEETKHRYKLEAEKAVELAKMALQLEKDQFKLEFKRSSDRQCRNCKGDKSTAPATDDAARQGEELRQALEEQRIQLEAEKERALEDLKQRLKLEKEKAIAETKKSQWCANCSGPAMYHCCWNTSYCGYTCQTGHWPQHMYKCEQQNRQQTQQSTQDGMVLARHAPNNEISPSDMLPDQLNKPD